MVNNNYSIPELTVDDLDLAPCPIELLCTEEEVYTCRFLSNLDVAKANGPDDIILTNVLCDVFIHMSILPLSTFRFCVIL